MMRSSATRPPGTARPRRAAKALTASLTGVLVASTLSLVAPAAYAADVPAPTADQLF